MIECANWGTLPMEYPYPYILCGRYWTSSWRASGVALFTCGPSKSWLRGLQHTARLSTSMSTHHQNNTNMNKSMAARSASEGLLLQRLKCQLACKINGQGSAHISSPHTCLHVLPRNIPGARGAAPLSVATL